MFKSTEERHWNGMELRTRGEWRELVDIDSFQYSQQKRYKSGVHGTTY